MVCFEYGERETDYLRQADPALGAAIDRLGHIEREVFPDLFEGLANSIVSQQISSKALATVWARIRAAFDPLTPEAVLQSDGEERLRACGLSGRKAGYIRSAATAIRQGALEVKTLSALSDGEIIDRLTALSGVGRWTAEMVLIFSLRRPDVWPANDLGICGGLLRLHDGNKTLHALLKESRARYSPYATVASFYLWEIAKEC